MTASTHDVHGEVVKNELCAALRRSGGLLADHLKSVDDGGRRVPGMSWTVSELGAHLVTNLKELTLALRGKGCEYDGAYLAGTMADVDDRLVVRFTERDLVRLSSHVLDAVDDYSDALQSKSAADAVPVIASHASANALAAIFVLDHQNHGSQLAAAGGPPWVLDLPAIRLAIVSLLPAVVNRDKIASFRGRFALHLRGLDDIHIVVDRGTFAIDQATTGVDCHIVADPVAFLRLNAGEFMTRRRAVLTGKLLVYGRKPWKMLGFSSLMRPVQHGGRVQDRLMASRRRKVA